MMVGLTGLTAVLMVQLATAAPKPIDTSLATIPTGYFGGSGATGGGSYHRSDADIAELANQRVIVIEKWEGPCWDECLANSSHTPPVACSTTCSEETYQLHTLRRVKALNPNVSGVFYLNTLYDFPYYNLTAKFAAADLHVRDIHGNVVGMQNDNGMLHIPVFDFSQPAAVKLFLDFHRQLIVSGLVDGTFPDKPNERAFQAENGTWWLCENPHGPAPKHSWAAACGELAEKKALAYNAGKAQMLTGLVNLYGKVGALWPVCSDGVEQCGSVCSRRAPCNLGQDFSKAVEQHGELVQTLRNFSYVYFMMGDAHGPTLTTRCTPDDIMMFLLVVEEGMIIGCNGRDAAAPDAAQTAAVGIPRSWWVSTLGKPLAPPVEANGVVSRSFESGVRVRYDLVSGNGTIDGWEALPPAPPSPPPAVLPNHCGVPLVDYGIGEHDENKVKVTDGPGECCDHCKSVVGCVAWAWHHEKNNSCHVHSVGATKSDTKHPGCISGFMNTSHLG